MTASLPVPHDSGPDDGAGQSRAPKPGPRPLPPRPEISAEEAAAHGVGSAQAGEQISAAPPRPRKPRGRAKKTPENRATSAAPPDPGPPPPLPADLDSLVVPPMPPLRAVDAAAVAAATGVPGIVVPPKPPAPVVAEVEPAIAAHAAPDVESAPVAEPEPEAGPIEAEPVVDVQPDLLPPPVVVSAPLVIDPAAASVAPAIPSVFDADADATSVDIDTAALSVQGVTKLFGETRAVDGIDLVVPPGIFYGLVGPNGAGKTTTLSMIAGLLRPDRGTVTVGGVNAAASPRAAKKLMGVLPDRLRTFDRLTGRQLLYYFGVLRGLAPAVVESRTTDLARAFDLAEALGRPVSDYSAGMVKKVMLAGAMIHSPRLLVLDEPFESVDPVSSAVILDILGAYVAHGGTVILSSHGMDLVERVCTRVAVMVAGQVLAEGTIDEVRGELTLEQRFVELAGGLSDVEGLEWLHTFSG